MIARVGKSLEAAARVIRPHLLPSYRTSYRKLLARGMRERRDGEPVVCCDFANPAIDAVGGRYYFSLVRDLIDAGYFPVFTARRGTLSTFGTSALKSPLLHERMGVVNSPRDLTEPFLLITDDPSAAPELAVKTVVVDYEWRVARQPGEIAFPFFIHPWIASQKEAFHSPETTTSRPARLFFGGNTEAGKYDKDIIRDTYHMLTRREMLAVAAAAIPAEDVYKPADASEWLASQEFHPFVFCETQRCKIPQNRWLEALAKADFFLACPGVGMPLCHNVIEALAAGSIPILQYAGYLTPPLRDGVDCLLFHDARSLDQVLRSILTMSEADITTLRAKVRAHYDEHLAPGCFTRRLFSGPQTRRILLLNDYRVPRA